MYHDLMTVVAPLENGGWPYPPINPTSFRYPDIPPPTFAQPPGGYGGPGYNIIVPFPNSPQGPGPNVSEVLFDYGDGGCSCHDKKPSWGNALLSNAAQKSAEAGAALVSWLLPDQAEKVLEERTGIVLVADPVDGEKTRSDPAAKTSTVKAPTADPAPPVDIPVYKPPFYMQTWFLASVAGGVGIAAAAYFLGNARR